MARDALGDDQLGEAGLADAVVPQNMIRRSLGAFGIKY
jgi:hypothetical protein